MAQSKKKSNKKSISVQLHPDPESFIRESYPLLKKKYGKVRCALNYEHPHELAISVILSAQCTDDMVNRVTPALFEKYREPKDFYATPIVELEEMIHSTGFYHNKAKNIQGFTRDLVEIHNGIIPKDLDNLVKMPGVGRKTANVILQELYDIPSGVVVDTHVNRLSKVLGLTTSSDPVRIERELMDLLPRNYWIDWSLFMIRLGRTVCPARKRNCADCVLKEICISSEAKH